MAFTEFYCRAADGSNLNAGSTNAAAAAFTYASGSWVASTGVFTVASGNPSSDGVAVGDFASVYPDGSSVGVFVGRVTARDATTITVSLTAKSGTAPTDGTNTRTLKIGGAWKGPNAAENFPFGFAAGAMTTAAADILRVNLKNGTTYSITAALVHNVAGPIAFQGMTTTAGDFGRAVIDGGVAGASYILLSGTSTFTKLADLTFQNNGATGNAAGLTQGAGWSLLRIVVNSVRGFGIVGAGNQTPIVECEAYSCNQSATANTGGFNASARAHLVRCISHDNTGFGFFNNSTSWSAVGCVADSNTISGFNLNSATSVMLSNCDSYNNGASGFAVTGAANIYAENCNAIKNTGAGWAVTGAGIVTLFNCGFGAGTQANGGGSITGVAENMALVTYAADVTPWVDPANGDFRVNLAAAKGAGRGSFTQTAASYTGTVAYSDIGAAQHQDSGGGGGGTFPFFRQRYRAR